MLSSSRVILLTGATGLLGRYLLRELLLTEAQIIVLVRDSSQLGGIDRIRSIVRFWNKELGVLLPEPRVLVGELGCPDLGLKAADRRWLTRTCNVVIHAAASLEFRHTVQNEPFRTNVEGTRRLLDFCQDAGIAEFHHVSTAFVCGAKPEQPVQEGQSEKTPAFNNVYEQSKWEAECLVRNTPGLQSTIYRPSIIVGDSRTGYTSTYHGIYRFAEMGFRLAQKSNGKLKLNIRLPLTGKEPRNLVPVDWVAKAILRIVDQPRFHGRIYHLVSAKPVPVSLIRQAGEEVLGLTGIRWGGSQAIENPSAIERYFLQHLDQYVPYLQGDPVFDSSNLRDALPDFQSPSIDRILLANLFDFAYRNNWGQVASTPKAAKPSACRIYIEETFPKLARRSQLGHQLKLEVLVGIDIQGSDGGQWTLRWKRGELVAVERGLDSSANVLYRMDLATFAAITNGRQSAAQAFFEQRLHLEGDVEKGLNLAVWFEQLLQEKGTVPSNERRGSLHESRR